MRAVNLLPRDESKKTRKATPLPVAVGAVAAVVVTGVLGAGFVVEHRSVSQKKADLAAVQAELAAVPGPKRPDANEISLSNQEGPREQALQQALTGRVAWDHLMREISLVIPSDVWLTSMAVQAPVASSPAVPPAAGATPAPAPTTTSSSNSFSIEGNAYSHEGVARLLTRLALVPDLSDVTLGSSTLISPGKRSAVQFTINASVRAPGGSS
jgi:Tfp pilus assembly protein PilN